MTLEEFAKAFDEAALVAASSKGVVVRARKALAGAKVVVVQRGDTAASVTVGDETVEISASGLNHCRCSCPATGSCLHMIAALMAVTEQTAADTPSQAPVEDPQVAITREEIEKFAGADWPRAVALAGSGTMEHAGGTVTVSFPETEDSVAFLKGQGLRSALHKGRAASRKRLAVAAAALVLAGAHGEPLPETANVGCQTADPALVSDALTAIRQAAQALAAGTIASARERLFSMAITARAEAVPRLAAEMRGAAKRLDEEAMRRADETPASVLSALARCHALAEALIQAPEDIALIGVLARSFEPSGPKRIAFVGAEHWTTPSGANGFTAHFMELATGRFYRAVHARAAGTDLKFDPRQVLSIPLWGLAPVAKMTGEVVTLPDAAIAADGGLGLNQRAEWNDTFVRISDLKADGSGCLETFAELETHAKAQLGVGLRARPGEAVAILSPSNTEPPVFDDINQRLIWPWEDATGAAVHLTIPEGCRIAERELALLGRKVTAGLVSYRPGSRAARLIALWVGEDGPYSLQFEAPARVSGMDAILAKVKAVVSRVPPATVGGTDPLVLHFDRMLEAVLSGLVGRPGLPDKLKSDTASLGLTVLSDLASLWEQSGEAAAGLRLAYGTALARAQIEEQGTA